MMDAMVPFKYRLPGAVSLLSPEDGSSVTHHVCFQVTTKKVRFPLVFTLLLFAYQVISQKLVASKGKSRSAVDPPSLLTLLLLRAVPSQPLSQQMPGWDTGFWGGTCLTAPRDGQPGQRKPGSNQPKEI